MAAKKIGIVGARIHGRPDQVRALVRSFPKDVVVVSGGGDGVDTWVEEEAKATGHETEIHRPEAMRRDALLARNAKVAEAIEELHTFPWLGARGTYHTTKLALARGIPVHEHPAEPRCVVYTARWGLRGDSDILNIMRGWAEKHSPAPGWTRLPADVRLRRTITWYNLGRECGDSLLECQKKAARERVPQIGAIWAPTRRLLDTVRIPLEQVRREIEDLRAGWSELGDQEPPHADKEREIALLAKAESLVESHWPTYAEAFRQEMRRSYTEYTLGWGFLLAQPRLVLACMCKSPTCCHRSIVAELLGKCGATVGGEL